ncbi:MAG TPA: hypothetical protein VLB68_12625 [Pyrinomonadaceae bacterium]|nr:hypothetical protein [Pyrinomonadaceae bacterium]
MMKRIEFSDATSNLLLVSSIMVALTPLILGDQLVLIVTSAMRDVGIWLNDANTYLIQLFS